MTTKVATYCGRPSKREWHTDARIYALEPPLLANMDGYLVEIHLITVSGIQEMTPMTCEGMPVYRLNTVCCTLDESAAILGAWLQGHIDHSAALAQIGYITEGKP